MNAIVIDEDSIYPPAAQTLYQLDQNAQAAMLAMFFFSDPNDLGAPVVVSVDTFTTLQSMFIDMLKANPLDSVEKCLTVIQTAIYRPH